MAANNVIGLVLAVVCASLAAFFAGNFAEDSEDSKPVWLGLAVFFGLSVFIVLYVGMVKP